MESRTKALLAFYAVATVVFGCATTSLVPTPTEQVMAALTELQAGWKTGDADRIAGTYSDDYIGAAGDKSGLRAFFEGYAAQGLLQLTQVGIGECKVVTDGDSATAGPVHYDAAAGRQSWSYTMRREADGVWRLIGDEQLY